MGRLLFVVPPFEAHVNPAVSVERELAARGHATAYVAHERTRRLLPDTRVYAMPEDLSPDLEQDLTSHTARPWLVGMRALVERVLVPMAAQMQPHVEHAIGDFAPDLAVVDQQAYAGAFAARKKGLRFVTSAASAGPLAGATIAVDVFHHWAQEQLAQAQRAAGVAVIDAPDLSRELVLLYLSRELAGSARTFPDSYRFVGPALTDRVDGTPFPWDRLHESPRLLVTLGTTLAANAQRFYTTLADALDGTGVQVIVSAPAGAVARVPGNFIVAARVPMMPLLPRVDAVLCHAGSITVEALAHGLPLVVAPISQGQATFARLACEAGAALRVRFNRVTSDALRDAVTRAIHDPGLRANARRVQASLAAAGGAQAAADAIERIL